LQAEKGEALKVELASLREEERQTAQVHPARPREKPI